MKGIVIAAGRGIRMRPLSEERPKCMLDFAGRPLLHHTMEVMRGAGCEDIVVILGHLAERVDVDGAVTVTNDEYASNNILHSLMMAREHLDGPVICTYSDIWVEPDIYRRLLATPGDVVLAVDRDWRAYYEGRSEHPEDEAENVHFDADGRVLRTGKHLGHEAGGGIASGEFLGLWRMSAAGARRFRDTFAEIDARLDRDQPFQRAAKWRIAYITDMVQELVDRGEPVAAAVVERGWAEFDTLQDYERLERILGTQRLRTLVESMSRQ